MIDYVAGFLIDKINNTVVLIKKTKPEWQRGRYNAIGGKVEFGETPVDAMQREFHEEAGRWIKDWTHRVTLTSNDRRVYFFIALTSQDILDKCCDFAEDKEETIYSFDISDIQCECEYGFVLNNISWLLPLCLDESVEIAKVWEK